MKLVKPIALSVFLATSLIWTACDQPAASAGADSATEDSAPAEAAEPVEWLTDYDQAVAFAGDQNKSVLINFTGSDWCPPCMALQREVLNTTAFNNFAAENLILLEIDFPRGKEQSDELVAQNQNLQQKYQVEGLPTLVLLNDQGEEEKRGGYRPGGPRVIIDWIRG